MVHALDEIKRVLKPNGILVDLRPVEDRWSVEVASSTGFKTAGYLTDMPVGIADDAAAFRAIAEAESRGWYLKEKEEQFAFFYYWDTPSEMKEFMDEEWDDFEKLEDEVYRQAKTIWASSNADARLRVRVRILITTWIRSDQASRID